MACHSTVYISALGSYRLHVCHGSGNGYSVSVMEAKKEAGDNELLIRAFPSPGSVV